MPRPILTARWTELLLLSFRVPAELIARVAPLGTEPDLYEGQTYISVIGFRFHAARLFGLPVPGHTNFAEVNLRYYVRRNVGDEVRRGVVFVREIVPLRAVAFTANWLYNENYITRPLRSVQRMAGTELAEGDVLEYSWRSRRNACSARENLRARGTDPFYWNRLAGRVASPLAAPLDGSLDKFVVDQYWGYVRARDGSTREYGVTHEPWQVATAGNVKWDCEVGANYNGPFAEFLQAEPAHAIVATGSAVRVYGGVRLVGF